MAGSDEIRVVIGGDAAGLNAALSQATDSMNRAAAAIEGAGQKANVTAQSFSRLENTGAMVAGRIVGMEAGIGMLGGQLGRLGAAAGFAGPLLMAMIPIALVAGAIELYDKWQAHLVALDTDVTELNRTFGQQNDTLMTQQERLAGITGGPLAQYTKEIADLSSKFPAMGSDISAINKLLEEQDNWWLKTKAGVQGLIEVMEFWSGMGVTAASTGAKDAEKTIAGIEAQIKTNADLASAIQKITDSYAYQKSLVESSWGAEKEENENALAAMGRYLDALKNRNQEYINSQKIAEADKTKTILQDQAALQKLISEYAISTAEADKEHADALAEIQKIQSGGKAKADTVEAANAVKDATIAAAVAEKEAADKASQEKFAAQNAVYEKEVAAAQGNADKIKELNQRKANDEQKIYNDITKANDEYQKKRVEAETKAADKIEEINLHAAEKQIENQHKLIDEQITGVEKAAEASVKATEEDAKLGIESKLNEQIKLKAIYTQELADLQAKLNAQIALENAARESGALGGPGSPEYAASVARTEQQQQRLNNVTTQYNGIIAQTNASILGLSNTTGVFLQKLIVQNQNISQQWQAQWQGAITNLNTGMAGAFNNWMEHGVSFGRSMANVAVGLLANFSKAVIEMGLRWVETHIMMALGAKATQTASAASTIASEAAVAGAGGVASMAAAPFPLDLSAPAFGAAAFAEALSYEGVAAAAGGGFVPGAVGEATPLIAHGQELVLPAHIASFLDTAARGGAGNKPGGGTNIGNVNFTFAPNVAGDFDVNKHGADMFDFMMTHLQRLGVSV